MHMIEYFSPYLVERTPNLQQLWLDDPQRSNPLVRSGIWANEEPVGGESVEGNAWIPKEQREDQIPGDSQSETRSEAPQETNSERIQYSCIH